MPPEPAGNTFWVTAFPEQHGLTRACSGQVPPEPAGNTFWVTAFPEHYILHFNICDMVRNRVGSIVVQRVALPPSLPPSRTFMTAFTLLIHEFTKAMRLLLSISCADPLPGPRSQPALKLVLEKKKQALEIVNRVGVRALQIRSISVPCMWRPRECVYICWIMMLL